MLNLLKEDGCDKFLKFLKKNTGLLDIFSLKILVIYCLIKKSSFTNLEYVYLESHNDVQNIE